MIPPISDLSFTKKLQIILEHVHVDEQLAVLDIVLLHRSERSERQQVLELLLAVLFA